METREEIWRAIISNIKSDLGEDAKVRPDFVLQSAMLEVLLDNRDLLVDIKDGLVDIENEVASLGP